MGALRREGTAYTALADSEGLGKSEVCEGMEGSQPTRWTSRKGPRLPQAVIRLLEEMDRPCWASVRGSWLGNLAGQRD